MRRLYALPLLFSALACVGTTGGDTFTFEAFARGPAGADGQSYSFTNGRGYAVTLTRARVHVGGVYLNQSRPTQVASNPSCTLPGVYVTEVTSGFEIDALSSELQPFPERGTAISEHAMAGEVWLTGGDVSDKSDRTVLLDVSGEARKEGETIPFRASLTIGSNRMRPAPPERPGAEPICKQRIVTPIPVDLAPNRGGRLILEIDPGRMFANVEFRELNEEQNGVFWFEDNNTPGPSLSLYNGLTSTGSYSLRWLQE